MIIEIPATFTKEVAAECEECLQEIIKVIPKTKRLSVFGEFNHLFIFLAAAKAAAPSAPREDQPASKTADEKSSAGDTSEKNGPKPHDSDT